MSIDSKRKISAAQPRGRAAALATPLPKRQSMPLVKPAPKPRPTKPRCRKNRVDASAGQVPSWQDLDQASGRKIVGNRVIRQHGKTCTLAHGLAHGERGIEKNGRLHGHGLLFILLERESPAQMLMQGSVGNER